MDFEAFDLKTRAPVKKGDAARKVDVFENVLNLEEDLINYGKELGMKDGTLAGKNEGKSLGVAKGNEIGTEVGYYQGCVSMWKKLSPFFPDQFSQRSLQALNKLESLLSNYSSDINPQNEELLEVLENIRAKFRQLSSLLGTNFKTDESLSF